MKTQKMEKIINLLSIFALAIFFFNLSLHAQKDYCIECHQELEDELLAPVETFKMDIHQQFGLSCADCHGGNPSEEDIDLAKDKTFKGIPQRSQIPEFCASCHSNSSYIRRFNPSLRVDQLDLYWTSEHGHLLKKGDTKVALCTDCHATHGIQAAAHPKSWTFPWNIPETCSRCHSDKDYMKDYKISTSQLDDYKESVHAHALFEKKDLSAPVCNDCHGNHGASPPEVTSIAFVCRQCHPSAGELFSQSPHKKAFDEMGLYECEVCHGNHKILPPSDEMLGTGEKAVCTQCHEPDSEPYQIASRIKEKLDEFIQKIQIAENLLERADRQGVEVSEPKFRLIEANTMLVMVRNLTHSFSLPEIEEKVADGEKVVAEVTRAGEDALREAKFRKTGLIIATCFIFLLSIALFLKIKQITRRAPYESP
ncbi:MAG: cytochrome c3 family protein [Candidatus Aminicenantes bacterium]|nr:MAG: cytochrome c3 family protein [Candidatus Aminicenantes bacterium]